MMTMMFFFKSNLLLQSWLLRFEPMKIHVRSASLWLFIVMKRVCLRERELNLGFCVFVVILSKFVI